MTESNNWNAPHGGYYSNSCNGNDVPHQNRYNNHLGSHTPINVNTGYNSNDMRGGYYNAPPQNHRGPPPPPPPPPPPIVDSMGGRWIPPPPNGVFDNSTPPEATCQQPKQNNTQQQQKPLLVLLDMNGTLLYRRKPPPTSSENNDNPQFSRQPDFVHCASGIEYYLRPGALELVYFVLSNPNVHPAILTSMRNENALPAVLELEHRALRYNSINTETTQRIQGSSNHSTTATATSSSNSSSSPTIMPMFCSREFNVPDKNHGSQPWDTMRCLERVWESQVWKYDGRNTIMIDDTARKMRHHPFNILKVEEYLESSVIANDDDDDGKELSRLLEYVKRLVVFLGSSDYHSEEYNADVRNYIDIHPWKKKEEDTALPSMS